MGASGSRLTQIDGLRAVAIVMVILFHYLAETADRLPYGAADVVDLAEFGKYGVQLFFMISGFVISVSLLRSRTFVEFARARLVRLLPAMVFCSLVTFACMWWIDTPLTQELRTGWGGLLTSWTFTDPDWWPAAAGADEWVDVVYWTLVVEVKFYVLAGIAHFAFGRRLFTPFFTALLVGTFVGSVIPAVAGTSAFSEILMPGPLGFFCVGIVFADVFRGVANRWTWALGALSALSVLVTMDNPGSRGLAVVFVLLFLAVVRRPGLVRWLGGGLWVRVGVASYPLYLVHNNVGVVLLDVVPAAVMEVAFYPTVVVVGALMVAFSFAVHRWVEIPAQRWLQPRKKTVVASGNKPRAVLR